MEGRGGTYVVGLHGHRVQTLEVHAARGWRSGGLKPVNRSLGSVEFSTPPLLRRVTLEGSRFHFDLDAQDKDEKGGMGNGKWEMKYKSTSTERRGDCCLEYSEYSSWIISLLVDIHRITQQ